MDPLSITAGILAVLGATKGATQCLRTIKNIHNAPLEVTTLTDELDRISALLDEILRLLEIVPEDERFQYSSILTKYILSASRLMDDMVLLLRSPSLHRLRLSDENAKRAAWFRNKGKIKTLSTELKSVRLDLCLALHTLTAYDDPNRR